MVNQYKYIMLNFYLPRKRILYGVLVSGFRNLHMNGDNALREKISTTQLSSRTNSTLVTLYIDGKKDYV